MSLAAFLALIASLWGVRIAADPWANVAIPEVRFVETAALTHRAGCGEIEMVGWPDGRREVREIRVRWPDATCPPAYLTTVIAHETAHARCWLWWSDPTEACAEVLDGDP